MTKLHRLYREQGQSPWLDDLTRTYLRDGTLTNLIASGIRGVTANPTIFARAIEGSETYDEQFRELVLAGSSVSDAYWELVIADVLAAATAFRATFDESGGEDGFVSIEVAPELADDRDATCRAARALHDRIAEPNVLVKIPATTDGVSAVRSMTAEGRSINVTLLFSLSRYDEVVDAYIEGLETFAAAGGDLSVVHSVASFFVSRVDTEVDRRLATIGTARARGVRGRAAIAQAKLAYQVFVARFSDERWRRLEAAGARRQRLLWASTSTKDPAYPDTLYVDGLIGPDTVNTLPEATITAYEDHGGLARTLDRGVDRARHVLDELDALGVDMHDVGRTLEAEGIASFHASFQHVLAALGEKSRQLVTG
jgi:transaldolase